jgi:hypothetical protein
MARQRFGPPYLLIFGGLFLLTSTAPLYRFLNERSDIWWTPAASSIPLHASRDRVEIYARGTLLQTLLEDGQLRLGADADSPVLGMDEVNLRFNNWDRVRAERIPQLLMYAASAGGAAAFMLVGLITAWSGRPRRRTAAG